MGSNQPVIGINKLHPKVRQLFTMAHELFHYLDSKDITHNPRFSTPMDRALTECKAKRFAASLLMPEPAIRSLIALGLEREKLLQAFFVSQEALDIRLRELRIA